MAAAYSGSHRASRQPAARTGRADVIVAPDGITHLRDPDRAMTSTSHGGPCTSARVAQADPLQGVLDAPVAGIADALVDRECLSQARGPFAGVTVLEISVTDSFQGTCFLKRRAELAGDDERLMVMFAGLLGRRGPQRQLAEAVQRHG